MSKNKIKPLDWMFMNKLDRKGFNKTLRQFNKKLAAQQRDIDPEIAKVVKENFWKML